MKHILRFVRQWRLAIAWAATLLILVLVGLIWPPLSPWLLLLEVVAAATLWVSVHLLTARLARAEAWRMRAERDAQTAIAHGLAEAIHQHMIATIRDRDSGPDAYHRAQELSDRARSIMFPQFYGQPAMVTTDATLTEAEAKDIRVGWVPGTGEGGYDPTGQGGL